VGQVRLVKQDLSNGTITLARCIPEGVLDRGARAVEWERSHWVLRDFAFAAVYNALLCSGEDPVIFCDSAVFGCQAGIGCQFHLSEWVGHLVGHAIPSINTRLSVDETSRRCCSRLSSVGQDWGFTLLSLARPQQEIQIPYKVAHPSGVSIYNEFWLRFDHLEWIDPVAGFHLPKGKPYRDW